jgi:hypothetical protein
MQVYTDFEDFTALGSQFGYSDGVEWHVARWSEKDKTVHTFRVAGNVPEERLSGKCLEAALAAIKDWETDPVWAD